VAQRPRIEDLLPPGLTMPPMAALAEGFDADFALLDEFDSMVLGESPGPWEW
jgi:hypothetical protein